jgi:hypothetical protein
VVAAFGRRLFDEDEIDDEDEDVIEVVKKKPIVSKYMDVFAKEEDKIDLKEKNDLKNLKGKF